MNLLGKIFILLIVVMSLVFMGLSMAVYSAHQDWPAEVDKAKKQLADVQAELERETGRYQRIESQLQAELDTAQQQVSKLDTERVALAARNDEIQDEVNALRVRAAEQAAAVASTQAVNEGLANENNGMRTEIRTNQEAKDNAFAKVVKVTELWHDVSIKLDAAVERNRQLLEQLGLWRTAATNAGVDPYADMPAPMVDGFVSSVSKRPGATSIEITIGADDGIKQGHTVEVYRDGRWLGRAEIKTTGPDRAVGEMIPALQKRQVLEGDRVSTRLKLT